MIIYSWIGSSRGDTPRLACNLDVPARLSFHMKHLARLSSLVIAIACATASHAQTDNIKSYMRVVDVDDNTLRMDMAFRIFAPIDGQGPTIMLGGAIHIADESFYELAQATLDSQDLILFEGVGHHDQDENTPAGKVQRTKDHLRATAIVLERYKNGFKEYPASLDALVKAVGEQSKIKQSRTQKVVVDAWGKSLAYKKSEESFTLISHGADGKAGGTGADADVSYADQKPVTQAEVTSRGGLQGDMAHALGLTFQLSAFDTDKKHYRNSDMKMEAIQDRAKASGGDADALISMMQGSGLMGGIAKIGFAILRSSPRMQGTMKVMMMEMLQQVGDDMTKLKQVPESMKALMKVLIEDRNQIVIDDLKKELASKKAADAPQSIAVWYGAGHMKDMEARLVKQLKYKPVATIWLPAITTDLKSAGMTRTDLNATRTMLQRMLNQ